jgi:Flp pilus assembly protein TadG
MRLKSDDDSGVVSIVLVLSAVLLIGVAGISVDVGRAVAVTRSAQNGADAVALARAKDCVRGVSSSGYNEYIRTGPAIGNGQSESLTGGSCGAGFVTVTVSETMDYTLSKVFGASDTVRSRSATARWGQLASGVIFPFTFSNCAFPDSFSSGNSSTPGTLLMLYAQGVRTTCPRDGSTEGQSANSKGFIFDGCQMTSIGETLTDANGNSFVGTACDGTSLDYYVGKDVLLPVWGSATSDPGGSVYTITTLVGFHVLGWSAQGNNRGGAMSDRCTASDPAGFKGDPTTLGDDTKPCLFGYVTSFTSTTGGTTGAPCLGSSDSLQPACFVYLALS